MKLNEAYNILGLTPMANAEETKKQYRKLTKEFHPDINKEAGAEDKFKKINEAYQVVSSGESTDRQERPRQNTWNPFQQQQSSYVPEHIQVSTTISFKDSVLGCKQELKFNRKTKCVDCNGQGEIKLNNGCDKCGGKGQIVSQQGGMIMVQTCNKCYGRSEVKTCKTCNSEGVLDAEATITVTIPGGIQNGNVLRLGGMGNYAGGFMGMDQTTDVFLQLKVTPMNGLQLVERNVVSNLQISLLEALQGCRKTVTTVIGNKEIEIKAASRNKDEVIIPHVGVNGQGGQRVILDIKYPQDLTKLIDALTIEGTN